MNNTMDEFTQLLKINIEKYISEAVPNMVSHVVNAVKSIISDGHLNETAESSLRIIVWATIYELADKELYSNSIKSAIEMKKVFPENKFSGCGRRTY